MDPNWERRSSFRELVGKAVTALVSGAGPIHERLRAASGEISLASMYIEAMPARIQQQFAELREQLGRLDELSVPDAQKVAELIAYIDYVAEDTVEPEAVGEDK
jgi:hypothetical protein